MLEELYMPKNLTTIPDYAFANCGKMLFLEIDIADSIGVGAFLNNTSIQEVLTLEKVSSLGASAFKGCTGITGQIRWHGKSWGILGTIFRCKVWSGSIRKRKTIIASISFGRFPVLVLQVPLWNFMKMEVST